MRNAAVLWVAASLLIAAILAPTWPVPLCARDERAPEKIQLPGIRNAFRVTPRILAGSQPEDDAAFSELAKAGVKTIISVDGAKPDVAAARRHGLRYIHLPLGYDGIPAPRVAELTSAARGGAGAIFVHCHHGKHRGPAAVGVICEATEGWSPEMAVAWMKSAGTSPDYPGLYDAAREFVMPAARELAALGPLPEVAKTPDLVDAMVAMDELLDGLKSFHSAGWRVQPDRSDRQPAAMATLLREHLRELARTEDTAKRPAEYHRLLNSSEDAAEHLRAALGAAPGTEDKTASAFAALTESCTACHKAFRNRR